MHSPHERCVAWAISISEQLRGSRDQEFARSCSWWNRFDAKINYQTRKIAVEQAGQPAMLRQQKAYQTLRLSALCCTEAFNLSSLLLLAQNSDRKDCWEDGQKWTNFGIKIKITKLWKIERYSKQPVVQQVSPGIHEVAEPWLPPGQAQKSQGDDKGMTCWWIGLIWIEF